VLPSPSLSIAIDPSGGLIVERIKPPPEGTHILIGDEFLDLNHSGTIYVTKSQDVKWAERN
jgi:hypothetical protein